MKKNSTAHSKKEKKTKEKKSKKNKDKKDQNNHLISLKKPQDRSQMSHNNLDNNEKNIVRHIAPLPEEALAIFDQFPADVLEEIFVHFIGLPEDRRTQSAITSAKQVCKAWHTILNAQSFWFKATACHFSHFIAEHKHNPELSFKDEFKKLACQYTPAKNMGVTWMNDSYWKWTGQDFKAEDYLRQDHVPVMDQAPTIYPCFKVLSEPSASLSSVCWLDVNAYATVRYPCRAKLLLCVKLKPNSHIEQVNVDILAGVKKFDSEEKTWPKLYGRTWTEAEQDVIKDNKWYYLDAGTVLVDKLGHEGDTIELCVHLWSHSGSWKNGLAINHLKCLSLSY